MTEPRDVYLIDAVRTPFGRYRGGLSTIRTDDLAALPIAELVRRSPALDVSAIDDVYLGNTNGAGEENRNVARMAALLAGLPVSLPGVTINRLCASGSEAIIQAGRAVATGDASLVIAGGVEGISRAPYVLPKSEEPLPRSMALQQTTVGWRMPNPKFPKPWVDSLGACAERTADELGIGRAEQDAWAARSHQLADAAWQGGAHEGFVMAAGELTHDECIRPDSTPASLAALRPAFTTNGTLTAGNSSPISDGALAAFVGTRHAAQTLGLEPLGQLLGSATVAVAPDRFSVAPIPAIQRVLDLCRELRRRGGGLGIAAACIGVGLGQAVLVRVS